MVRYEVCLGVGGCYGVFLASGVVFLLSYPFIFFSFFKIKLFLLLLLFYIEIIFNQFTYRCCFIITYINNTLLLLCYVYLNIKYNFNKLKIKKWKKS